ncbi:hypothetical protein RAD15_23085 [Bradyrhizobium sp. 14AA]
MSRNSSTSTPVREGSLGYFKDEGLQVDYTASQGGDKAMAGLPSGSFDIARAGPETAIYVDSSQSPTKVKMFCGLTTSVGTFLWGAATSRSIGRT